MRGEAAIKKEKAIEAHAVTFAYRQGETVIKSLSLCLFRGETAALVGANGAGKTTLGKLLAGILKPAAGRILLFGEDQDQLPLFRIGQKVGYCFQNPVQQLFTVSVEQELAFGLKYRGASQELIMETTEALMHEFEIEHLRHAFPLNLSWGEKRRVTLAACLALNPEFLVLDEPTTGLDEERIGILNQILNRLRIRGVGSLLISHNQEFVSANAQRILRIEGGVIADDRCC